MIFQKNRFLANTCMFASVLIIAILGGLAFLPFTVETSDLSLTFFVVSFSILAIFALLCTVTITLDNNSTVVISEDGIQIKSRIRKHKYISWEECGFIGIYGYYYGMQGVLVFSTEKYTCYSLRDCRRFANKNRKSIIMVGYTPEFFAAVEKYAPTHLVSGCKALFPRQ